MTKAKPTTQAEILKYEVAWLTFMLSDDSFWQQPSDKKPIMKDVALLRRMIPKFEKGRQFTVTGNQHAAIETAFSEFPEDWKYCKEMGYRIDW